MKEKTPLLILQTFKEDTIYNNFMPINSITEKMDKFFVRHQLSRLTQEEKDNLNSFILLFKKMNSWFTIF